MMTSATIDRFEEGLAILIVEGREERRAREDLPAEAREGDVIDLETMQLDARERERLEQRVRDARAAAKQGGTKKKAGSFDL